MSRIDTAAGMLIVAILLTEISVFTEATPLTLIALFLGGVMIVLGSLYSYRQGAFLGVLIVATGAASSINLESVLEVGPLLTAILGLLLPTFLLALHALRTEQGGIGLMGVRGKAAMTVLLFGVLCVFSAPLIAGLAGTALPTLTIRLSAIAEIAIMLIVTTAGGILLTRRTSARRTIALASESAEEGA